MRSVSGARAVPNLLGFGVDLSWRNPPASAFESPTVLAGIRIVRRERTFPLSVEDGTTVYPPDGTNAPYGSIISRFTDRGLQPLTTYYYTVFAFDSSLDSYANEGARAYALASDDYRIDGENLVERLYKLLPAVHQRYDRLDASDLVKLPPAALAALAALPPELRDRGPLRRFLHAAAAPLNVMRSTAEGLRQLHDVDRAPAQFLLPLAHWIGWDLDRTLPVYAQRNEIKLAPRLYRSAGTVPNLRAIVNRYTNWNTQVAEFEQHIARSNVPPQLNSFAMFNTSGIWRGIDDASAALGFFNPNSTEGTADQPARLDGAFYAPFALRPGMELTVLAHNNAPMVVRFERGDFVNIAAATSQEVCDVLNRTLSDIEAIPNGAQIILRAKMTGQVSSFRVEQYPTSLVSLEGAPRGRLSAFSDNLPNAPVHLRLFYETFDPLEAATERAALRSLSGEPFAGGLLPEEHAEAAPDNAPKRGEEQRWLPAEPAGRIRYKTFRDGAWGEAFSFMPASGVAQREPAACWVSMPDGSRKIFLAWINDPVDAAPLLGFGRGNNVSIGVDSPSTPALLVSTLAEPFRLRAGMAFTVVVNGAGSFEISLNLSDFADIGAATAAELAEVFSRSDKLKASALPDGRLQLATKISGAQSSMKFEIPARLSYTLGTARAAQPAHLRSRRSAPFNIVPGTHLVLRGSFPDEQIVEFVAADFADPQNATAQEVAAALNGRLKGVEAVAEANSTVLLKTLRAGGDERLAIDLWLSTAAKRLGFEAENSDATGDWGDEIDWDAPRYVASMPFGRYADLFAIHSPGMVWLFFSSFVDTSWRIACTRWDMVNWWNVDVPSSGGLSNREPSAALDVSGRMHLVWTQKKIIDPVQFPNDEAWGLRRRFYTFTTGTWSPEYVLTDPPAGRATADREPGAVFTFGNNIRVYFRTNREGGPNLWHATFALTNPAHELLADTSGAQSDYNPTPILLTTGVLWLLHRSDRSVNLSRVATRPLPVADNRITTPTASARPSALPGLRRSTRMPDTGTLRRYAGTTSVTLKDETRNSRRRLWDDLLSYTPQKPRGPAYGESLRDNEFYTRGTVGLYLTQVTPESPLSEQLVKRLLPVLVRFLPVNVRVVVILAPRVEIEYVYGQGTEIQEAYYDRDFVEVYPGVVELTGAKMPGVKQLVANSRESLSARVEDKTTLRGRTFSPPPE